MPPDLDKVKLVIPAIQKMFDGSRKTAKHYRLLFEVFETVQHDPAKGRIRLVDLRSDPATLAGLPEGTTIRRLTGTPIGATEVRTCQLLAEPQVRALGTAADEAPNVAYGTWAHRAERSAAMVLFDCLQPFDTQELPAPTLAGLPANIGTARGMVQHLALDLLVSEAMWYQVLAENKKDVERVLSGGAIVPVPSLPNSTGYVVPHKSGHVIVEPIQTLTVSCKAEGNGVCLIASEEFIVVRRRPLPVVRLSFSS